MNKETIMFADIEIKKHKFHYPWPTENTIIYVIFQRQKLRGL